MKICRGLVIFLFSLVLTSCLSISPDSRSKLKAEVESQISVGMAFSAAVKRLEARGFNCTDVSLFKTDGVEVLDCARERSSVLLFGCVQRVWIAPDVQGDTLREIKIFQPACTGF